MDDRVKRVLALGLVVTALVALTACQAPKQAGLAWGDSGKPVTIADGGTVTVALEANPSTGYTWAVASAGPLVPKGEPEFRAGGEAQAVGAPGVQVFTFEAPKAGTGTLTLVYARPWESKQPEKTWSADVTVK